MRRGGGKAKGAGFERQVCKALSLLVSDGASTDVFWRSAMSGGRATVHHAKGVSIRQAGDICAVAPEGHEFCDRWFVECKNVKDAGLSSFLISNTGPLAKFWQVAKSQARRHKRSPMIIIRARGPVLVITKVGALELEWYLENYNTPPILTSRTRHCDISLFGDMLAAVPAAAAVMKGKKND